LVHFFVSVVSAPPAVHLGTISYYPLYSSYVNDLVDLGAVVNYFRQSLCCNHPALYIYFHRASNLYITKPAYVRRAKSELNQNMTRGPHLSDPSSGN